MTCCNYSTETGAAYSRRTCGKPSSPDSRLCPTHRAATVRMFAKTLRPALRNGDAGTVTALCIRYPLAVAALDTLTRSTR